MDGFERRMHLAGGYALGAGTVGLGLLSFLDSKFLPGLLPAPGWLPAQAMLATLLGAVLTAAGLAMLARRHVRLAALAAGAALFACLLVMHLPALLAAPGDGGAWGSAGHLLAWCASACALAAQAVPDALLRARENAVVERLAQPARIAFGLALLVFGALHLMYHDYMSRLIPAWIPGAAWWPYVTGSAQLLAGASFLGGVRVRLAALAAGAMFAAWVVLLHVPRVLADARVTAEWSGLLLALALAGGAWAIAASGRGRAA